MIRLLIFILLAFIIFNVVIYFIRILLGSSKNYERMGRKASKSKYEDVEEAKFKEIDDSKEKNDKT